MDKKIVYAVVQHCNHSWVHDNEHPIAGLFETKEEADKCRDHYNEQYLEGIEPNTVQDLIPLETEGSDGTYCYYKVWPIVLNASFDGTEL